MASSTAERNLPWDRGKPHAMRKEAEDEDIIACDIPASHVDLFPIPGM